MTIEEKLSRAIEFIRSIESLNKNSDYEPFDLDSIDTSCTCNECGSSDCSVVMHLPYSSNSSQYVDKNVLDGLVDKAWHVLADITE